MVPELLVACSCFQRAEHYTSRPSALPVLRKASRKIDDGSCRVSRQGDSTGSFCRRAQVSVNVARWGTRFSNHPLTARSRAGTVATINVFLCSGPVTLGVISPNKQENSSANLARHVKESFSQRTLLTERVTQTTLFLAHERVFGTSRRTDTVFQTYFWRS